MRSILMAWTVAFCFLDVARAEDKPTVVAVWEHRVIERASRPTDKGTTMTLYSNHKIDIPDGKHEWSRSGNTLILTWDAPNAPDGKSIFRCTISPDGQTYTGQNQNRKRVVGKLVSSTEEFEPKAPAAQAASAPSTLPGLDRNGLVPTQEPREKASGDPTRTAKQKPIAKVEGSRKRLSAREALEQGAAAGDAQSMFLLGLKLCYGSDGPKDEKGGIAWLEKAANAGHAEAMNDLGHCYRSGKWVKKDINLAKDWFEKAAKAGSPSARRTVARANGKKSWDDIPNEQQLAALGLFLAAWSAASALDSPPTGTVAKPQCQLGNGLIGNCPCRGFVAGGLRGNPDPSVCRSCLHSQDEHNR